MQHCTLQIYFAFPFLFDDGLHTIICKDIQTFCPKASQITYAQNSTESREEERLNILEQVKKYVHQQSVYRKIHFDINARQVPFNEGDQVLTKIHKAHKRGVNLKILPKYRPDNQGKSFTVLKAHQGYCQLLDTSADKYFFKTIITSSNYHKANYNLYLLQFNTNTTLKLSSPINRG